MESWNFARVQQNMFETPSGGHNIELNLAVVRIYESSEDAADEK